MTVSSHALLVGLISRKIDFIGTNQEMLVKLDEEVIIGRMYSFNFYWKGEVIINCGLVTGTLLYKNKDANGIVTGYVLRVSSTNTSIHAPKLNDICTVNNIIELLGYGKRSK